MKRTWMVKAIAMAMSTALLLQPISVFAEGEYNAPIVDAVNTAEEKVEAALPSEEPVVEAPVADEPVVEAPIVEAPVIVAQEPTDTHLNNVEGALESIEGAIEGYNEILENSEDDIKAADEAYEQAVETAKGSEAAFEQAAADAKADAAPAVANTIVDWVGAYNDAEEVIQKSEVVYQYQVEAEAAKAEATQIAAQAQAKADDAAQIVTDLGEKVVAAEDALVQANDDYQAAEKAYDDAKLARQAAEIEYDKLAMRYGLNNSRYNPEAPYENFWNYGAYGSNEVRTAITEAKAALESARRAEKKAGDDYNRLQGEYTAAQGEYNDAVDAANEASGKLADAEAALAEAKRNLDKAELILAVNQAEDDEINTYNASVQQGYVYNRPTEADVKAKDDVLAQGLIKIQLFDLVDNVEDITFTTGENGEIIAKYPGKDEDGNPIEIERKFTFKVEHEQNIHGHKESAHWLVLDEIVPIEKEHEVVVDTETYYVAHRNSTEPVSFNIADYQNDNYRIRYEENGNKIIIEKPKKNGKGWEEVRHVYVRTRDITETQTYFEDGPVEFYKEATYYRQYSDFSGTQAAQDYANAAKDKKDLEDIIGKPGTLEDGLNDKLQAANDAAGAKANAGVKYQAVKEAYDAVIAAAKKLKELQKVEAVSKNELEKVRKDYFKALANLGMAESAYYVAAYFAGETQKEADRALRALEKGFEYEIPTPVPNPNPNPSGEGEIAGTPTTGEPAYIPVLVAAAPAAPAPEAAVLGETRARNRGAAAVEEAGDGEEEIKKAAPAAVKKQEEKKEETKPAVAIEDEDTARAAAPIETKKGFPWWILIILAAIAAVTIEEYVRRKNNKENNI